MAGTGAKIAKFSAFLLVAAVVAYLCWIGVIPVRTLTVRGQQIAHNASTAVQREMRKPGYREDVDDNKAASMCRDNLRAIQTGKIKLRERMGVESQRVNEAELLKAMGVSSLPQCPRGGTYSIGTFQTMPYCSLGAQDMANKNDDHAIYQ